MEQAVYLGSVIGSPLIRGLTLGGVLHYTASDTFAKADWPGLRAVLAHCQAGGGGGGGAGATGVGASSGGGGGGGGEYARGLVLASDLDESETITVGARGSRGSGANPGGDGGSSSFGAHVIANGGSGGLALATGTGFGGVFGGIGGSGGTGDLLVGGDDGGPFYRISGITRVSTGNGGGSHLGGGGRGDASDGKGWGGGGGGNSNGASASAAFGGWGTQGIVIVELLY